MPTREDLLNVLAGEGDADAKAEAILELFGGYPEGPAAEEGPEEPEAAGEAMDESVADAAAADEGANEAQEGADAPKEEKIDATLLRVGLGNDRELEEKEIDKVRINAAIDVAVAKAHVRNEKTEEIVKRCIDKASVKVDKDGNVSGVAEQIKALREDEQTAFLFKREPKPRQRYEPAAGKETAPVSYGRMFAEDEAKAAARDLNATFEGAILGAKKEG